MHHIKPTSKGDPLCPLGFHPQVRWPTRCKRCFRDYKEHGNRNKDQDAQLRKDELTVSTPALSSFGLPSRSRNETSIPDGNLGSRTWTSSSNLSSLSSSRNDDSYSSRSTSAAASWTSSPNLAEDSESTTTVSITLPRRRPKPPDPEPEEDDTRRTQFTVRRRTGFTSGRPSSLDNTNSTPYSSNSTPSYRNSLPAQKEESIKKTSEPEIVVSLKPKLKPTVTVVEKEPVRSLRLKPVVAEESSSSDDESTAYTDTTDTTIVNDNELKEELETLKKELEQMKARCEKAEREKSDLMLRRLASVETTSSRTAASEVLKLQQRCNELKTTVEDLQDEKKSLNHKVRELEADLEVTKSSGKAQEAKTLKEKLQKAEKMCEELMEENEDMKREIREMEEEMDEMSDKFREDRADEYTSLKKELDQSNKNCRILSFKLRKSEKKAEQLEAEKLEIERKCREVAGGQSGLDKAERIRQLEHDLKVANEAALRLQKDLEDVKSKSKPDTDKLSPMKKKPPMLGSLQKIPSSEKMSRESLTRGDSQEDPAQLLRDLQDSLEREADLREQLRFAEEEADNLRKKASRVEDDNESLVMQLKKMATKARTRRHSPSAQRLTPEPLDKDEGISDEDDPAELRILLELNEQEASVLRRKVEELEVEGGHLKQKVKELQDKLNTKTTSSIRRSSGQSSEPQKASSAVYEQKMKVLDEEINELRKKLIEKDRECERLHAEISLGTKKPKVLQKSKSLDGDQQTVDLKRQLQVIESEASILRSKTQSLEAENEKLLADNKKLSLLSASRRSSSVERVDSKGYVSALEKQLEESNKKIKELEANSKPPSNVTIAVGEMEKLKTQLKKTEKEKLKFEDSLKRLKELAITDVIKFYQQRTPRKPTDLSTKLQLKKMVDESENEINEILVALKRAEEEKKKAIEENTDTEKASLQKELQTTKEKLDKLIKEAKEDVAKKDRELEKLNNQIKELQDEKIKVKKDADKNKLTWEKEKAKLTESNSNLEKKEKDLKSEIDKLKLDLKGSRASSDEVDSLNKKIESLNKELEASKKEVDKLKKASESVTAKGLENTKLSKQIEERDKKLEEIEKKLKEVEDKLKKSEKLLSTKKDKLGKAEKEKEELTEKISTLEKEKEKLSVELKELNKKLDESESKVKSLQEDLKSKTELVEKLESGKATGKTSLHSGTSSSDDSQLKSSLESAKKEIKELTTKLEKATKDLKETHDAMAAREKELQKEIDMWEKKASDLEMDLHGTSEDSLADRKMMDRLKAAHEQEMKAKDIELAQLKAKSQNSGTKKLAEVKQELQTKIDSLELALESEKREYDELTSKYEQLEEEYVIMKATMVKDKEKVQSQLLKSQGDCEELENELSVLRETFSSKQDSWIREKHKLEDKAKECETLMLEKARLQAFCDEKQSQLEQLRKEVQGLIDQNECMKKDNEELRCQMDDYQKVEKVQRNMTADLSALERELKDCKTKLVMEEKQKKKELTSLKSRYDKRANIMSEELLNVQGQMARFKKERDSYRHMLDESQKTISELRASGATVTKVAYDGEDPRGHIAALEQQIGVLEDELSESRVDASRLRTELVSERSSWEVKMSELNSRLNELEEEKILSSGRTKITGLKTRMELAWQKEREEQHRLLQETSTLARDLRQTLFEVERERDRERLEAKRRLDLLKKTNEDEQEEIRKKLHEMQCDLLELRDAHAKLRTTNEKLRREKDKLERDRELLRSTLAIKKRAEQDEERQIISVAQLVEELTVLAPDLFPSKPKPPATMPTPPARRKGPRSREASPLLERKDFSRESSVGKEDAKTQEVHEILRRLSEAATELRKYQQEDRGGSMSRKGSFSSFRAGSIESDTGLESIKPVKMRGLQRKGSSLRKSLSLEQSIAHEQQAIWRVDDDREGSLTSVQSLDDGEKYHHPSLHRRDPSMDSRLSTGSTQSEILPSSEKKKKLSLFGKLTKKLTKSRSFDNEGSEMGSSSQIDPGSDTSLNIIDERGSSKQLKDKFSGMFKKSGSASRGNSLERNVKPPKSTESTQRPLIANSDGTSSSRPLTKKPPSTAPVQRKVKK